MSLDLGRQAAIAEAQRIHEETVLCHMAAHICSGLVNSTDRPSHSVGHGTKDIEEEAQELAALSVDIARRIRTQVLSPPSPKRNGG